MSFGVGLIPSTCGVESAKMKTFLSLYGLACLLLQLYQRKSILKYEVLPSYSDVVVCSVVIVSFEVSCSLLCCGCVSSSLEELLPLLPLLLGATSDRAVPGLFLAKTLTAMN